MLRKSPLFQFKHGDHICVFYRSEDALMETLTPHFAEGLRRGERCFGVQKSRTLKRLFDDLRFLGIDPEKEVKRGSLVLHTDDTGYLTNGKFEPEKMIDLLLKAIDDCVKDGYSGFRSAGDLTWAAKGRQDCNQVIGYEKMVEDCFPGQPAVGLCQYSIDSFPPDVLEAVLATHKTQLVEEEQSAYSSLSLGYNGHTAEIVASRLSQNPTFNYVVQERYSKDLIGWGSAADFSSANQSVEQIIRYKQYVH
jgi:hypothetical protein